MALVPSGALALKDLGPNPTSGGGSPTLGSKTLISGTSGPAEWSVYSEYFVFSFPTSYYQRTLHGRNRWYGYDLPNQGGQIGHSPTGAVTNPSPTASPTYFPTATRFQFGLLGNAPITAEVGYTTQPSTAFGSFNEPNSYTDAGGTSRTIAQIMHCENQYDDTSSPSPNTSGANGNVVAIALYGTGIPNSDTTFAKVSLRGIDFPRPSATYFPSLNGGTVWYWINSGIHPSGTPNASYLRDTPYPSTSYPNMPVVFYGATTPTVTYNNGIAEEFGTPPSGNDVKLSHYYQNSTTSPFDPHATPGIPSSGQISFSNFYGKTFQSAVTESGYTAAMGANGSLSPVGTFTAGIGWGKPVAPPTNFPKGVITKNFDGSSRPSPTSDYFEMPQAFFQPPSDTSPQQYLTYYHIGFGNPSYPQVPSGYYEVHRIGGGPVGAPSVAPPYPSVQPTDWTSMEIEEVTHNGSSDPLYSPHSPRLFPRASSVYGPGAPTSPQPFAPEGAGQHAWYVSAGNIGPYQGYPSVMPSLTPTTPWPTGLATPPSGTYMAPYQYVYTRIGLLGVGAPPAATNTGYRVKFKFTSSR